jgi:hypothetical protein
MHLPASEDRMIELRKRMGISYIKFVEKYIKCLPIDDEQKNKIFIKVIDKLQESSNLWRI